MTTFNELISDVRQQFQNYLEDEEEYVTLVGDITDSETVITVDSAQHVDRGVIEIDDEPILIKSIDKSANQLAVRLRGHLSTTAVSHTGGALIRLNPLVPNQQIKRMINDTIAGVFPTLFQVKIAPLITYDGVAHMYQLPTDVGELVQVKFKQVSAPSATWIPMRGWDLDDHADVTDFPNQKALWVMDQSIYTGDKIQCVYTAAPTALAAGGDTLESTAGLPASCRDLISLGTMARILPAVEAGRLQHNSIEQSVKDQVVRPQDAIQTSRFYWQLYAARLEEEGKRLQDLTRAQYRETF